MKKKKHPFIKFLLGVLFFAVCYLGYLFYTESDFFVITQVNIIAQNSVSEEEIIDLLGERPYYFKYNNEALEKIITDHPLVKKCDVKKIFPNKIEVILKERQPVIALSYSDQYLLIDEDLVVVESTREAKDYYIVSGYYFEVFQEGATIAGPDQHLLVNTISLVYLLNYVDLEEKPEILIDNREILLVFNPRLQAKFGDGNNIEARFNKMLALYMTIKADGNAVGTIIVNHDGPASLAPFDEK